MSTETSKKKKKINRNINHWRDFGINISINTLIVIIFYLVGCNVIWFTKRDFINKFVENDYTIHQLLPSFNYNDDGKIQEGSYNKKDKSGLVFRVESDFYKSEGKEPVYIKGAKIEDGPFKVSELKNSDMWFLQPHSGVYSGDNLEKASSDEYSTSHRCMTIFPGSAKKHCNGYYEDESKLSWTGRCGNWFHTGIAQSYILQRAGLRGIFKAFSKMANHDSPTLKGLSGILTILLFFIPIILLSIFVGIKVLFYIPFIITNLTLNFDIFRIFSKGYNPRWGWGLLMSIFGGTLAIASGTAIIQALQFCFSLLVVPLILRFKEVCNIMINHANLELLIFLFGFGVIMSAHEFLTETMANTMTIVFAIYTIYRIWKLFERLRKDTK